MEMRKCGKGGLRLSVLGIGCWEFGGGDYWGPQSQAEADAVVRRAFDLGINYFDLAESYNDGRSERSFGRAIKGLPRDRIVIGTKVAPANTAAAVLVEHCEASLRRLRTEYVDLYMVHWPITPRNVGQGPCPSAAEAFATLRSLQEQGKVRHVGVSNFSRARLDEARAAGAEIAANQLCYSLLARAIEFDILPCCRAGGVGVIAYLALMQGLLTGKYRTLDEVPPLHRRTRHFDGRRPGTPCRHGEPGAEDEVNAALAAIRRIAEESGRAMPELALGWAIAQPGISCVLAGCRTPDRVDANARAASAPPGPEVVARLSAATDALKAKLGPSFDYWQTAAGDRTQ
jgi:aryl-alcohol dehydrogenase-like predicted oxidoreductase